VSDSILPQVAGWNRQIQGHTLPPIFGVNGTAGRVDGRLEDVETGPLEIKVSCSQFLDG
jgi:hypothetical protein